MFIKWLETTCGMQPPRRSFWLGQILTAGCRFGGMDQSHYGSPCRSLERRFSCTTGLVSICKVNQNIQIFLPIFLSVHNGKPTDYWYVFTDSISAVCLMCMSQSRCIVNVTQNIFIFQICLFLTYINGMNCVLVHELPTLTFNTEPEYIL